MNHINRHSGDAATIRPCTAADMPAVAAMFHKTFRPHRRPTTPGLANYLRELFIDNPDYDPDLASRVLVAADGAVAGFIGILPARMTINGRAIRAAVAGSFMVDRPAANPLAGARLLRAYFAGPQDLSISESANPVSQAMWTRVGATIAGAYSMEWLRVLRPAGCAVAMATERAPAARFARLPARGLDSVGLRTGLNRLALALHPPRGTRSADADDRQLSDVLPALARPIALQPDWSGDQLAWRLRHGRLKNRHGPRTMRIVTGRNGAALGCYVYYGRPGGIAWVLQLLANAPDYGTVVDDLLAHARDSGCVAVRGKMAPGLSEALLTRRCLYFHRSSTVYRTGDPAIDAALRSGDALVTGLAGESWSQLIGHG